MSIKQMLLPGAYVSKEVISFARMVRSGYVPHPAAGEGIRPQQICEPLGVIAGVDGSAAAEALVL